MIINELLEQRGMTKYKLSKQSGVPHATISVSAVAKPVWRSVQL